MLPTVVHKNLNVMTLQGQFAKSCSKQCSDGTDFRGDMAYTLQAVLLKSLSEL